MKMKMAEKYRQQGRQEVIEETVKEIIEKIEKVRKEVEYIISFVDITAEDSDRTMKIKSDIVNKGTEFIDEIFSEEKKK